MTSERASNSPPVPPSSVDTRLAASSISDDYIYVLDAEERFIFINAAAARTWKRPASDLLGKTLAEELPPHLDLHEIQLLRSNLKTQTRTEYELFYAKENRWLSVIHSPDAGGIIVHIRPLQRPLNSENIYERDELTGCLTRRAFLTHLEVSHLPNVLAILDLNRLKAVNELRGHSGGDIHIRDVARALLRHLPSQALVCRWGGDEFVVVLPGHDLVELDERLAAAQQHAPPPMPGITAFAVGTALWPEKTLFERAFVLADERLQQAKQALSAPEIDSRNTLAFVSFSQLLESLQSPEDIIQTGLGYLLPLLDFDVAYYMLLDGEELVLNHHVVRPGQRVCQIERGERLPLEGFPRKVQQSGQTAWSTDYPSDPDHLPNLTKDGVKSTVVVPVRSEGKIIATLSLFTLHRWRTITPYVRHVVELAALRLEHALELRRVAQEVRSTLEAGLFGLGVVLEARDLETHGHTERVTHLALRLGTQVGLNLRELDHLREGAFLHDLGKLSISDAILQKPGRLDAAEWEEMKTHVTRGWELASRIPNLSGEALSVIRHHHERWDGTGYPDALAGEAVPYLARIFAICDVYDALISERPYKGAWSVQAALEEIAQQAGRQFDPAITAQFLDLLNGGSV